MTIPLRPRAQPRLPSPFDAVRQRFLVAPQDMLATNDLAREAKAEEVQATISAIMQIASLAEVDAPR